MKKLIAYALFVLVCGLTIFFTYRHMQASRYEATAVPYIKAVLPQISSWDPALVNDYMAAEVLERVNADELKALMLSLSQVGELKSIDAIRFENKTSGDRITKKQQPLVTYELTTQYSSGEVKVTISLLDKGDSFDVYHFNFQSQALAP